MTRNGGLAHRFFCFYILRMGKISEHYWRGAFSIAVVGSRRLASGPGWWPGVMDDILSSPRYFDTTLLRYSRLSPVLPRTLATNSHSDTPQVCARNQHSVVHSAKHDCAKILQPFCQFYVSQHPPVQPVVICQWTASRWNSKNKKRK